MNTLWFSAGGNELGVLLEAKQANSARPDSRDAGAKLAEPGRAGRALADARRLQELVSALRPREGRGARTLPTE